MKLNGRGQTKTGAPIHPSKRGAGSRRSERSMHSVRSRGRRHRKRRLVRELGGSRQGNRHPWWFSPDDRDWLCSPDRSRRCVSLHMLVTAAEFLLGPRNRHPWWFSPDDRDWLCSPDRSRRCVSLHMLVTAAEFLLGPTLPLSKPTGWQNGGKIAQKGGKMATFAGTCYVTDYGATPLLSYGCVNYRRISPQRQKPQPTID